MTLSFPISGYFQLSSLQIFSPALFLSSPSWVFIMQILLHCMLSKMSVSLSSFLYIVFSLFCSMAVSFINLSSSSLFHSVSFILLLIPSVFFTSVIVLFVCSLCLLAVC